MRSPYGSSVTVEDWQAFQAQEQRAYRRDFEKRGNYFGHFSIDGLPAVDEFAVMIAGVDGPVLDIGCGILPMPRYLKECCRPFGIDPYYGEGPRLFPFAQAIGEHLPFRDGCFAGVSIMSALDHAIDPLAVLREAWRVLDKKGRLFIWYISRRDICPKHTWSFGGKELNTALAFGFSDLQELEFAKRNGFPKTHGVIARKI